MQGGAAFKWIGQGVGRWDVDLGGMSYKDRDLSFSAELRNPEVEIRPTICDDPAVSLAYALVTALLEQSSTGADLARRFDRSIGYFWPASHQQIYRELARLESDGMVGSTPNPGTQGRQRTYRVLPAGVVALREWVAIPREPRAVRDELLVKLRAEAVLGNGDVGATLRLRLERHRARLTNYREMEARSFGGDSGTRERRLQSLILRAGIEFEELWVRLCEDASDLLDADVSLPGTED